MELFVLRHAIALTASEAGVSDDAERPLSMEGRAKMKRIAEAMDQLGLEVDLILSSPLARARETAVLAHEGLGLRDSLQLSPSLAAGEDPKNILAELKSLFARNERILIVGHEPDLSALISRITAASHLRLRLKKAALAMIQINGLRPEITGTLEYLLPPKVMLRVR